MDDLITRAEAETMVTKFKRNPNTTETVLENMKKGNKSVHISGREKFRALPLPLFNVMPSVT